MTRDALRWVMFVCLLQVFVLCSTSNNFYSFYPNNVSAIPVVTTRLDPHTGKEVTRGHQLLPHHNSATERHHVADLKRILQCAVGEPSLNQHTGSLSLIDMLPLNSTDHILLMTIFLHTKCVPWSACHEILKRWKDTGESPRNVEKWHLRHPLHPLVSADEKFYLLRVMNQELYVDWTWNASSYQHIPSSNETGGHQTFSLFHSLLQKVDDLPNSVFFFSPRSITFPWDYPFPFFSEFAKYGSNQMPWPWTSEFIREYELTSKVSSTRKKKKSKSHKSAAVKAIDDEEYDKYLGIKPWNKRINKAVLVTKYEAKRHILIELARKFPSLFVASITFDDDDVLRTVNPTASEGLKPVKSYQKDDIAQASVENSFGGAASVLQFRSNQSINVGEYKYVIVPMAEGSPPSSNQLLHYLAHCHCVILLQSSAAIHHFSSRLKPWVHYVPISYSGADAAERIAWLQANDKIAQQIADNAHNFGKSYLRLEDYYCYAITALERAAIATKSISNISFYPIKLLPHHESHQQFLRRQ